MKLINASEPMSPRDFHTILQASLKSALTGASKAGPEGFDAALEAILSSLVHNMGMAIAASSAGDVAMVDEVVMHVADLIRKTAMDATKAANERVSKAMGA